MTPEERQDILTEMDVLDKALGNVDAQIQAIADRESNGALMAYPHAFSDPALTARKQQLIDQAGRIVEKAQRYHDRLVGKP